MLSYHYHVHSSEYQTTFFKCLSSLILRSKCLVSLSTDKYIYIPYIHIYFFCRAMEIENIMKWNSHIPWLNKPIFLNVFRIYLSLNRLTPLPNNSIFSSAFSYRTEDLRNMVSKIPFSFQFLRLYYC